MFLLNSVAIILTKFLMFIGFNDVGDVPVGVGDSYVTCVPHIP